MSRAQNSRPHQGVFVPAEPLKSKRGDKVLSETKERYLNVAAELAASDTVNEPAYAHVVSHIRFTEVAAHLGIPRSSLYRLWENQHDYWSDLTAYIASQTDPWPADPDTPEPKTLIEAGNLESLIEYLRVRFETVQTQMSTDASLVARAALAGYPAVPEVAARISQWHRTRRREIDQRLAAVLRAAEREPVDPLTTDDLAAMVWMTVVGVTLLGRTEPSIQDLTLRITPTSGEARHDESEPWRLLPFAVTALLVELSKPAETSPSPVPRPTATQLPDHRADTTPAHSAQQIQALEAGAGLFEASLDIDPSAPHEPRGLLGHVTLARVARAAGVSRRHLHNVWPRQEDLTRDLVAYLREIDHNQYFGQFEASIAQALDSATVETIGLRMTDALFATRLPASDHPGVVSPQLALQPHLGDPIMRDASQEALERLEAFQQKNLEALAELFSVEFRRGITTRHVNLLIIAISNGSVALHRLDPHALRRDLPFRDGSYSTLAISVQALIDHSMVPA